MANTKEYKIIINGVQESINAVESLNKQLGLLESKINALSSKAVNISSSSGGGGSRSGALSEEEKLQKQIAQTEEKRIAYQKDIYQTLLAEKDLLKETVNDQKQVAAQERLTADAYSNTMQGMKDKLADIKAVMQTVDLGDVDTFQKLTNDANELNAKLLEIEKSYGQFGRNVGNYASAAEGFKGLKITVGDTVMEFDNARQALKALKQEMQTLQVKNDSGIISPEEAERFKSLIPTVKQLESSIQDAGKPMDNLMDTMQSIVALASAGKGLAAFFGLENTGVEESIKKLVALQNVLTSFQTIQKQLQTEEGLGKYFSKGSKAIDNFVAKLLGVKTASVQVATAEKTATVATNQLATASKGATLAVKGLSTALKAIGIGLLIGFISSAVDGLSNLFKKTEKGKDSIDALDMSINALNRSTENMMQMYDKLYDSGSISRVEKLTEQYKLQAEYVENIVEAMRQRQAMDEKSEGIDFGETFDGDDSGLFKVKRDIEDVREEWEKLQYNITNGIEEENLKINVKSWLEEPKSQMDELNDASKQLLNDFVGRIQKAEKTLAKAQEDVKNGVAGADEKLKEAKKTIKDLEAEMNNDRILNSVIANLDKIIPEEGVRKACQSIFNSLHMISTGMDADAARLKQRMHDLVIGVLPEQQQALARAKEQYEQDLEAFKNNLIGKTLATVKYNQEVDRINSSGTTSGITTGRTTGGLAKSEKNKLEAKKRAEEKINELTLKLMSEGLYKELMKLDENNRKEIDKIKKNGEKVEEQLKLQYQAYEEEQKKLLDRYVKDIEKRNASLSLQNQIDEVKYLKEQWDSLHLVMNRPTSTKDSPLYGISDRQDDVKKLIEQYKSWAQLYDIRNDELTKKNWKGYFEALKKDYLPKAAKEIQDEFNRLLEEEEGENKAYKFLSKTFEQETSELKYFLTKYQGTIKIGENEISQILEDSYLERLSLTTERFNSFIDVTNKYINESLRLEKERIDKEEELEKEANKKRLENTREGYEKLLSESQKYSGDTPQSVAELLRGKEEKDLTEEEKILKNFVKLIDEYENEATQITKKYATQRNAAELDAKIQQQNNNYKYYEQSLANLEDYIQKASDIVDKQPEVNKLGFIDLKKTKEQYKEVLDMYKHMPKDIERTIAELLQALNNNEINGEQFDAALNNLEFYKKKVEENVGDINEKIKQHNQDFFSSINEWIQQVGQAASQIMQSLWDYQDNVYDRQVRDLEKQIDEQEKLLDKQKDMIEKHADAVNAIEDELSTARGDRRQHLIDQLNAEIAAQRAAAEEEKQLEKKKEALEKKKEKMAKDQWEKDKARNVTTALMNAAMAISQAAANNWPMPAIPLIALATAVGAAQVASIEAQRYPYAKGGLLEGPSHSQGGIPVGNTGIEVEGDEYVIRKKSTKENVPVLDFINKSERKLTLDDFIDFYSTKPRATIKNIKSKFADGGVIPSTSSLDIGEQLQNIVINQDDRPIYVSVVDINNKQADVRRVQALAGL